MRPTKIQLILAAALLASCGSPPKKPTAPSPGPEVPTPAPAPTPEPIAPAPTSAAPMVPAPPERAATPIADAYRDAATRLLADGTAGKGAWSKLAYLTDHIGNRIAGSKKLDQAIAWAQKTLADEGHENVHTEKVMVGHWERGEIALEVLAPAPQKLHAIALGLSPGTGKKGITAEVVVVDSFEALTALGAEGVKGKIVLFNHPMPAYTPEGGTGYGEGSTYRTRGPAAAARLGAVAALTRSATARSLRTPHTGVTLFRDNDPGIPAAAVATEDAELIARLAAEGPVKLKLVMTAKNLGQVPSANVIAELRGREKPEEIVLLGAHLDSWDVGQGAQDDGAGCVIMMEALSILRRAGFQPRRTIRVVLYTNEEHGIDGAFAYGKDHAGELANHVAAIESDGGSFKPVGLSYEGKVEDPAYARLADLLTLLAPLGATALEVGHSGTDLIPLAEAKIPCMGHDTDSATYFDIHHTEADTLDKVDPTYLQQNAVMMAIVAYVLADMPERLGQ
jgi:carboxypeptidase Q